MCVCMCLSLCLSVYVCLPRHELGGTKTTCGSWFYSSIIWFLGFYLGRQVWRPLPLPTKVSLQSPERDFRFFRSRENGRMESLPLRLCKAGKRDLCQQSGPVTKMQPEPIQDMAIWEVKNGTGSPRNSLLRIPQGIKSSCRSKAPGIRAGTPMFHCEEGCEGMGGVDAFGLLKAGYVCVRNTAEGRVMAHQIKI